MTPGHPLGDLTPVIPHSHFLARPNHAPEVTDRLIMPREPEHGVTHRHIRTPTPHAIDLDPFLSSSTDDSQKNV